MESIGRLACENVLAIRLRYNIISANTPGKQRHRRGVEQTVLL
jgi:hypothetical protein